MPGIPEVSRAATDAIPVEPARRAEPALPVHAPPEAEAPTAAQLEDAVATLNRVLAPLDLNVNIRYDDEINRYRVKIVDRQTNEIIREIPNRGVLEAARQAARGLFVDHLS